MLMKQINDAVDAPKELNENFVDIEQKLVIAKIIEDKGKITDGAQRTVLAVMLSLARDGKLELISNFNEASPEEDIVNLIKVANDATILKLAEKVMEILNMKDADNNKYSHSIDPLDVNKLIKTSAKAQE